MAMDIKHFRDAITRSAMSNLPDRYVAIGGAGGQGGGGAGGTATVIGSGIAIGGAGGAGVGGAVGSPGGFAGSGVPGVIQTMNNMINQGFGGNAIYDARSDVAAGAVGADRSFKITNEWYKDYNIVNEMIDLKMKCNMALIAVNSSLGSTFYSKLLYKKLYIAGGCFTSWLHGEKPKDIDIFVIDSDDELVADFAKIKNNWEDSTYNLGVNKNVKGVYSHLDSNGKTQLIFTTYKSREELISDFDFVHTMVSYDTGEDKLYLTKQTYDAIIAKNLIRNRRSSIEPHNWRIHKFKERGWYVSDASV